MVQVGEDEMRVAGSVVVSSGDDASRSQTQLHPPTREIRDLKLKMCMTKGESILFRDF